MRTVLLALALLPWQSIAARAEDAAEAEAALDKAEDALLVDVQVSTGADKVHIKKIKERIFISVSADPYKNETDFFIALADTKLALDAIRAAAAPLKRAQRLNPEEAKRQLDAIDERWGFIDDLMEAIRGLPKEKRPKRSDDKENVQMAKRIQAILKALAAQKDSVIALQAEAEAAQGASAADDTQLLESALGDDAKGFQALLHGLKDNQDVDVALRGFFDQASQARARPFSDDDRAMMRALAQNSLAQPLTEQPAAPAPATFPEIVSRGKSGGARVPGVDTGGDVRAAGTHDPKAIAAPAVQRSGAPKLVPTLAGAQDAIQVPAVAGTEQPGGCDSRHSCLPTPAAPTQPQQHDAKAELSRSLALDAQESYWQTMLALPAMPIGLQQTALKRIYEIHDQRWTERLARSSVNLLAAFRETLSVDSPYLANLDKLMAEYQALQAPPPSKPAVPQEERHRLLTEWQNRVDGFVSRNYYLQGLKDEENSIHSKPYQQRDTLDSGFKTRNPSWVAYESDQANAQDDLETVRRQLASLEETAARAHREQLVQEIPHDRDELLRQQVERATALLQADGSRPAQKLLTGLPPEASAEKRERWIADVREYASSRESIKKLETLLQTADTEDGKKALLSFMEQHRDSKLLQAYGQLGERMAYYQIFMREAMNSFLPEGTLVDARVLRLPADMLPGQNPKVPLRKATRSYYGGGLEYEGTDGLTHFLVGGKSPTNFVFDKAGKLLEKHTYRPAEESGALIVDTAQGDFDLTGNLMEGRVFSGLAEDKNTPLEIVSHSQDAEIGGITKKGDVEAIISTSRLIDSAGKFPHRVVTDWKSRSGYSKRTINDFDPGSGAILSSLEITYDASERPRSSVRTYYNAIGQEQLRLEYNLDGSGKPVSGVRTEHAYDPNTRKEIWRRESELDASGDQSKITASILDQNTGAAISTDTWSLAGGKWTNQINSAGTYQRLAAGEAELAVDPKDPDNKKNVRLHDPSIYQMYANNQLTGLRIDLSALQDATGQRDKLMAFVNGPLFKELLRIKSGFATAFEGDHASDHLSGNPGAMVMLLEAVLQEGKNGKSVPPLIWDYNTGEFFFNGGGGAARFSAQWVISDFEGDPTWGINLYKLGNSHSPPALEYRIPSLDRRYYPSHKSQLEDNAVFSEEQDEWTLTAGGKLSEKVDFLVWVPKGAHDWTDSGSVIRGSWDTTFKTQPAADVVWESIPKAGETVVAFTGAVLAANGALIAHIAGNSAVEQDLAQRAAADLRLNPLTSAFRDFSDNGKATADERAAKSEYYIMDAPDVMAREAAASDSGWEKFALVSAAALTNFGLQTGVGLASFGPLGGIGGAPFQYAMTFLGAQGAIYSTGDAADAFNKAYQDPTPENELAFYRSLNNWSANTMPYVSGALYQESGRPTPEQAMEAVRAERARGRMAERLATGRLAAGNWLSGPELNTWRPTFDMNATPEHGMFAEPARADLAGPARKGEAAETIPASADPARELIRRFGSDGAPAAQAYALASAELAKAGLTVEGVAGSFGNKAKTPRLHGWPETVTIDGRTVPLTFEDAARLDKMPSDPSIGERLTGRNKALFELKQKLIKEGGLPSDLDVIAAGDHQGPGVEAARRRIFEQTGVYIELVEPLEAKGARDAAPAGGAQPASIEPKALLGRVARAHTEGRQVGGAFTSDPMVAQEHPGDCQVHSLFNLPALEPLRKVGLERFSSRVAEIVERPLADVRENGLTASETVKVLEAFGLQNRGYFAEVVKEGTLQGWLAAPENGGSMLGGVPGHAMTVIGYEVLPSGDWQYFIKDSGASAGGQINEYSFAQLKARGFEVMNLDLTKSPLEPDAMLRHAGLGADPSAARPPPGAERPLAQGPPGAAGAKRGEPPAPRTASREQVAAAIADDAARYNRPVKSGEANVRPEYSPDYRSQDPNVLFQAGPQTAAKVKPGGRYNYVILADGTMEIAEVRPDNPREMGVKHVQIANRRPLVFSGELVRDAQGRLRADLNSGTYSEYGKDPRWAPTPENLGLLRKYASAIMGEPVEAVDYRAAAAPPPRPVQAAQPPPPAPVRPARPGPPLAAGGYKLVRGEPESFDFSQTGPLRLSLGESVVEIYDVRNPPVELMSRMKLDGVTKLVVYDPKTGNYRKIAEGMTLELGRDQQSDIVLGDPRVSRKHARVSLLDGKLVLEDLSTHGTRVEALRAQPK